MRSSIDGDGFFNCLGEIQFQGDFGWFSVIFTVGNLSVIPFENKTIGRGRYCAVEDRPYFQRNKKRWSDFTEVMILSYIKK